MAKRQLWREAALLEMEAHRKVYAATAQPPRVDCPKCGDPNAFGSDRVQFVPLTYGQGTMRWECRTCWYAIFGKPLDEPTKDVDHD